MKKFIVLSLIGVALILIPYLAEDLIPVHEEYQTLVIFFIAQTAILFRMESIGGEKYKVQMRMVNIGFRMISAFAFLLIMGLRIEEDLANFYIQFIVLYLVFMTFEITWALTNLRRN